MPGTRAVKQAKPNDFFFHLDGARGIFEMANLHLAIAELRKAYRGDGHTILIIPGFTSDDPSTRSRATIWVIIINLNPIPALAVIRKPAANH